MNAREALQRLACWDMLSLDADGHGVATADAPWARQLIADALDSLAPVPSGEVETPETAVEAMARADHERTREVAGRYMKPSPWPAWEKLDPVEREAACDKARVMLDAAKPHLIAQGWTPPGGTG